MNKYEMGKHAPVFVKHRWDDRGCLSADWAFSPIGCWVAGTHYSDEVVIHDARDFSLVTSLPT